MHDCNGSVYTLKLLCLELIIQLTLIKKKIPLIRPQLPISSLYLCSKQLHPKQNDGYQENF